MPVRKIISTEWICRVSTFLFILFGTAAIPANTIQAASQSADSKMPVLTKTELASLSTEEKIGQLFLVTFQGNQIGKDSRIFDLIVNRHIGGVLLENKNDNFSGPDNVLQSTYDLTTVLQTINQESAIDLGDGSTNLPLFIAIAQNGDRAPLDQVISGMSPLPNQLAIGASWNPELAYETGKVIGSELSNLGFNMFIGPSLDVMDNIQLTTGEDLGAQVFGGDPYWVGVMGQQYINGLHEGSENRMAVISKNFPGRGSSDRPTDEEVATVRKSLEQLKQIELAPFFAVTGNVEKPTELTDGLLVSHIRYQGFQGNIRATTKPVSFDSTALSSILALEPLTTWRNNGGVVISDRLGSQSIKRFFDPTGNNFDARQIARNAFLAGNDILIADQNFISNGDADTYTTITRTLDLFIQKYNEDPAFAQRVDQSVSRIIALKQKMYPDFHLSNVIPDPGRLNLIGSAQQVSFQTARENATLISPDVSELKNLMPSPPETSDRIVFFTDTMAARQCSTCADEIQLGMDSLQSAVLKLYGPHASGQVFQSHLVSYSFSRLMTYLNDPAGDPELEDALKSADWVVFSILNLRKDKPESSALWMLLNSHQDLIRNKKTIVFAFNAPYYLDATDISKLTAYYALYSKAGAFIEIAARILFQEITPSGASPVSIPGVGYEIIVATSPDPNQVIGLSVDTSLPGKATPETTKTAQPPVFQIGDTLPLITGVIIDHNGNPVPDGTVARFLISNGKDTVTTQQIESITHDGIATASYQISQPGRIEIKVVSEPAMVSQSLQLEVKEGEASQVTAIAPTAIFTPTSQVTPTPEDATKGPSGKNPGKSSHLNFMDWLLSILITGLIFAGVYQVGRKKFSPRWGIRWAACAAIGAQVLYSLSVLVWRENLTQHSNNETLVLTFITLVGGMFGWGIGYIWMMLPRWLNKP